MKKQVQPADVPLRSLAERIGDFIRYWGFRRIHGQIWAVLYLSDSALSGVEIVKTLKVSKALVSPALKELESEGLIEPAPSENSKLKRYRATEDVAAIIKAVLKRREMPMIDRVWNEYQTLSTQQFGKQGIREDRYKSLGSMIQMAQFGLKMLVEIEPPGVHK